MYSNQNSVYWHMNNIDQWNRVENSEINQYIYGQLSFDRGDETIHWRMNSLFNWIPT